MWSLHQQERAQPSEPMQRERHPHVLGQTYKRDGTQRERQITGCPRRLTWADIGGKPRTEPSPPDNSQHGGDTPCAQAHLDRVARASALRSQLQGQASHQRSTNALTGAAAKNNRRPCRLLTPRQPALPQSEWRPPSPGATPGTYGDLPMFHYHRVHHPVAPVVHGKEDGAPAVSPTTSGAPFTWPEDDFPDVFGHGGALD